MKIDLQNLTDACGRLYLRIQEHWEQWKYNREYNIRYYKEKCDWLKVESQKQKNEIYTLQDNLNKYKDLMAGLMGIGEGFYRCRDDIACIISYKLEDNGYSEKKLDLVLHQVLPVFQANATTAKCRIYPDLWHAEKTILSLDFIITKNNCRNHGLGSEMIRYMEEIAEKLGVDVIVGDIKQSEANEYALRVKFYSNLGYEIKSEPGINKIRKELKGNKN